MITSHGCVCVRRGREGARADAAPARAVRGLAARAARAGDRAADVRASEPAVRDVACTLELFHRAALSFCGSSVGCELFGVCGFGVSW